MLQCALTAIWCFSISYTILDPSGYRTEQEWIGFDGPGGCQELKEYYETMLGKPLYGFKGPGRQRHQFTVVVTDVECTHMGRL
jgi:hypothetical protein